MSSHHFVREGQEPALLVIDAIADDHLMSLLEWSPLVMVTSDALSKVATWGIRVDVVLVEKSAHIPIVMQHTSYIGHATIVNVTSGLADAVLDHLQSLRQHTLHVLVESADMHFARWESGRLQIILIDERLRWSRIMTGRFEKWFPEKETLHIHADQSWEVTGASGDNTQIETDRPGLVTIRSSGPFWVGEYHR